jgi:hypothetical protein
MYGQPLRLPVHFFVYKPNPSLPIDARCPHPDGTPGLFNSRSFTFFRVLFIHSCPSALFAVFFPGNTSANLVQQGFFNSHASPFLSPSFVSIRALRGIFSRQYFRQSGPAGLFNSHASPFLSPSFVSIRALRGILSRQRSPTNLVQQGFFNSHASPFLSPSFVSIRTLRGYFCPATLPDQSGTPGLFQFTRFPLPFAFIRVPLCSSRLFFPRQWPGWTVKITH